MEEPQNIQEVERVMHFAKLDLSEFIPVTQCLQFKPELDENEFKLFEVDEDILQSIENNERVVMRGQNADKAMLCTPSRSYLVQGREISNQLMLVNNLQLSDQLLEKSDLPRLIHLQVGALKQDYFEVIRSRPLFERLRKLLKERPYAGQIHENEDNYLKKKYKYEDLLNEVQASEKELNQALKNLEVIEFEGFMRLLDFDYKETVLQSILTLIESESWSDMKVPSTYACNVLEELYPRKMIAHVLKMFSNAKDNEKDDDDDVYVISEDKVCRHFAELILSAMDLTSSFRLDEFEKAWKESVPDGMKTGLYQLEGLAVIDRDSRAISSVSYFPVFELSEDVTMRFDQLFKKKSKWTLDEITPYLKDLCTEKIGVSSLLTKNARTSTQNGIKMYSTKKPF